MKALHTKTVCLGFFSLMSSLLFANQNALPNPANGDAPRGFWVVESHPKKKEVLVRFYTMDNQLVHIEKVPAKEANLKRKTTIRNLNEKAKTFAGMYKMLQVKQTNPADR